MPHDSGRVPGRLGVRIAAAVCLSALAFLVAAPGSQAVPAPDAGGMGPAADVIRTLRAVEPAPARGTAEYAQWYAERQLSKHGWEESEMRCLIPMWIGESHWDFREVTGRYVGIPQTTRSVVESYGFTMADYRESAEIQVKVGLRYIDERYGSPCRAWSFWKAQGAWQDDRDPSQWWGGWY